MGNFMVLAEPRSGTTFFNSILDQHDCINCLGEVLPGFSGDHSFHNFWLNKLKIDASFLHLGKFPSVFSEYISFVNAKESSVTQIGFDIKYYQLEWLPDVSSIFLKHGFKVIHIIRKNILKRLVSYFLHSPEVRTKLKRPMHTTKPQRPVKVHMPSDTQLLEMLDESERRIEKYRAWISRFFSHIEIFYEDMVCDIQDKISKDTLISACSFLGVPVFEDYPKTTMKKMNPDRLRNIICNYHEIVRLLHQTKWYYLLDDPKNDIYKVQGYKFVEEAEIEFKNSQPKNALKILDKAQYFLNDDYECCFHQAICHAQLGDLETASFYCTKSLENSVDAFSRQRAANLLRKITSN